MQLESLRTTRVCGAAAPLSLLMAACSSETFTTASDAGSPVDASADAVTGGDAAPACPPGVDFKADPKNCGTCGRDCLDGACAEGMCLPVKLADGNDFYSVSSVVVGSEAAYLSTFQTPTIYRVDKASPYKTSVVVKTFGSAQLALAPDALWWTDSSQDGTNEGGIYKLALPAASLAQKLVPLQSPRGIAIDSEGVFVATDYAQGVSGLLSSGFAKLAEESQQGAVSGLATDGHYVYWTSKSLGVLRSVWKLSAGRPARTIVTGQASPESIAIDAKALYWSNSGSSARCDDPLAAGAAGSIMKANLLPDGLVGAPVVLAADEPCVDAIAIDGTHVYWSNAVRLPEGRIRRVAKSGGPAETLLAVLGKPRALTLDANGVYYIHEPIANQATLYRVAK